MEDIDRAQLSKLLSHWIENNSFEEALKILTEIGDKRHSTGVSFGEHRLIDRLKHIIKE